MAGVSFAVEGDPDAVRERASLARSKGRSFTEVGEALTRVSTDGWRGRAAERFWEQFEAEPERWRQAGSAFGSAASALDGWADALTRAQQAARAAAAEYQRGQQVSTEAQAAYESEVAHARARAADAAARGTYLSVVVEPFVDPGQAIRDRAVASFAQARTELDAAAQHTANAIRAACARAPGKRNWLESGLAFLGGVVVGAGEALWELGRLATMAQWRPVADMLALATGELTVEELAMRNQLSLEQAGAMLTALRSDPVEFGKNLGKAVLDWDTWADDPARALGHLVPDAVATVLSGGAGAAARGLRGADAVGDLAEGASDVNRTADGLDTASDLGRLDDLGDIRGLDNLTGGPDPLPDLSDIPHEKGTDEWAQAVSERYPRLTTDDVLGIYDYTTNDGYQAMNPYLRDGAVPDGMTREMVEARIQRTVDGLGKLPTHEGVTYRGTNLPPDVLARWQPGQVVPEDAFSSTTLDRGVAESFGAGKNTFIRIEGHSGSDITPLSQYGHEVEILFKPGTEFEVLRREWNPDLGRWEFDVREVHR